MTISNNEKTKELKPAKNPRHGMYLRRGLLIIVTLIVMGSISYYLYCFSHEIKILTTEASALKQQQIDTQTRLDTLSATQTNLTDNLNVVQKTVTSALQERGYQNRDWLLMKARYSLELAEVNAHWSDNTQTTIALFQQTDALLASLYESDVFSVRQEISKEIAQLQAIPTVDIAGVLARLDAAQHRIGELPTKNPLSEAKLATSTNSQEKSSSTWREHLQSSLHLLKKLVVIRHHDEAIQPYMTPGYESLLRETIHLNLQEAQWAVIQHNQDVYQLALTQAIDSIKQGFDVNAKATQALIEQLTDLHQIQLKIAKPTPGQSLLLLNQLIDAKKAPVVTENAGENR